MGLRASWPELDAWRKRPSEAPQNAPKTPLTSHGRTHGAWDDEVGYVKASFARIVEAAAAERSPVLPKVRARS